jgi:hypothetical protein
MITEEAIIIGGAREKESVDGKRDEIQKEKQKSTIPRSAPSDYFSNMHLSQVKFGLSSLTSCPLSILHKIIKGKSKNP